uniref:Putative secreted protein n=1 Tax=Anopheles marajoara TaxID=58244 RepID=A0A2M4C957_9DIPT
MLLLLLWTTCMQLARPRGRCCIKNKNPLPGYAAVESNWHALHCTALLPSHHRPRLHQPTSLLNSPNTQNATAVIVWCCAVSYFRFAFCGTQRHLPSIDTVDRRYLT